MKKNMLYFVGLFVVIGAILFFIYLQLTKYESPGYVLMGFGHTGLETTFVIFSVSLIIIFVILYFFFRFLGVALRLPNKIRADKKIKNADRSQNALITGLVDSAAGNWEKAEKVLIKHAANSGAPLLHYLTAARAAQSRGAIDKRDEYLRKATNESDDSNLAVGLTQVELHLSENQFDAALKILTKLHSLDPTQMSILSLLQHTHRAVGNWDEVRKLLPVLHKNQVLGDVEQKLLEVETYSSLLQGIAKTEDVEKIQALWVTIPPHIQKLNDVRSIYFAAVISADGGAEIEEKVAAAIFDNWNDILLIIFANIQSSNYVNQLLTAEKWLASHPENAVLLRVLGKISLRCDQPQKAEEYLSKSINLEPTVAGYQLLGDLFYSKNDKTKSSECYKYGLELASNHIESLAI